MRDSVAVILLSWVWVRIDDGVFVEHLAVRLIFRQALKVGDLVYNFRFDLAQSFGHLLVRQTTLVTTAVVEPRLGTVLWHNIIATSLWALNARLEIVRAAISVSFLSESWIVRTMLALFVVLGFRLPLSNASSCVSFKLVLQSESSLILLCNSLLTGESWFLAARAPTSGTRWGKAHNDGNRHLISHLITPSLWALHLWWVLYNWALLRKILSPSDSSSVFDSYMGIWVDVIAKLKASSVLVLSAPVSVALMLIRSSVVAHRDVALALDMWPDWRNIVHCSVSVRAISSQGYGSCHGGLDHR
jgi:hypothetical protein